MGLSFSRPVQLEQNMVLQGFSCGQELVDSWLATYASKAKARGSAVVYVSYCINADMHNDSPAGFYTLSSASIERDTMQRGWLKRNTPPQVPVILLGMLGVDLRYQGSGLGAALLHDAALRALSIADSLGAKALVVDPIDENAEIFYAHYGFEIIPGLKRMYVPLNAR